MSTPFDDSLHPRGEGGRFSSKEHGEADITLGDTAAGTAPTAVAERSDLPVSSEAEPQIALARRATAEELWNLIDDDETDPHALTEAAINLNLASDQIVALADHSQPVLVRRAVATLPHSGVADIASHDPDVFVRMTALGGWDLSPTNRQRLLRDPVLIKIRRVVAH